MSVSRRQLLSALGAGVVAGLPWRRSAAAETDAPKRLIVISHCHGWPHDAWRIRPDGLGDTTPWEVDLTGLATWSDPLAPLRPHAARLLAVDGLSLVTAELDVDGNRHDTGWVHATTGSWADFSGTDTRSTAASLDQRVAAHVARPDRLPSLELTIDGSGESGRPIAYAATGGRLPVANTPQLAWQRLFGLSASADPLVARQRDVVGFARAEAAAVRGSLGRSQRHRLDAHFDLLGQVASRIDGLAGLACPQAPAVAEPATYDERFDAFAELIGAAFACDVTRVVSLSLGELPTPDFGAAHLSDDVHKGIAHEMYDDAEKHAAMARYVAKHAEQVARLVDLLAALPDADGRTVMDNTLILWGSELANGWHGYRHWCPVVLGGGWHFRTGRYLFRPHATPVGILVPAAVSASGYTAASGLPHQHLLVSVAQAMGLDTDTVGIARVQGQTGEHVDCTGPLLGLV